MSDPAFRRTGYGYTFAMQELAGMIGWVLRYVSEFIAPNGWTRRRALVVLFLAVCLSATLLYIAWPDGLPS